MISRNKNKIRKFAYDLNGNMTRDRNRLIWNVKYNTLNLPEEIEWNDGHITRFTYAADGRKLRSQYLESVMSVIEEGGPGGIGAASSSTSTSGEADGLPGGVTKPTFPIDPPGPPGPKPPFETVLLTLDYCGGHVYRDGALERSLNEYGYRKDSVYYYYVKDYQGNVRAVIDQNGVLKEINNYYPYGGLMGAPGAGVQPLKYGGKELDRENGLDWLDFGARRYDPALPMFTTMDPLCEQDPGRSPYAYCAGNPIRYIDPTGMQVNMSWFSMIDQAWGTHYQSQFLSDLNFITGLSLYENENGMLDYNKDENGNPLITHNDDGKLQGSATARNHLMAIINDKETITIGGGKTTGTNNNEIGFNFNQMAGLTNSNNYNNLDIRTLGWGMTFMHESYHTNLGGGYIDNLKIGETGDVVDKMNVIRSELNSQGYNFGQRMHYSAISIGGYNYIGFDLPSFWQVHHGCSPSLTNKYIRIKNR